VGGWRRSFRRVAACLLLGVMLFNFLGEGWQLFNVALALVDLSPATLLASVFSIESKPVVKSCCAGEADDHAGGCSCPDCGDHCPMGAACTCDSHGHRHQASEGLFFTLPGCHPDDGHGAQYLPLS